MKRFWSILTIAVAFSVAGLVNTQAQTQPKEPEATPFSGVNGVVKKEHIANKKYIPYAYVREADMLWSKTVWRMIDMREKLNQPLYYPTRVIGDRRNLIQVIIDAVEAGDLVTYDANASDEFAVRLSTSEFKTQLGNFDDTADVVNAETGIMEKVVAKGEYHISEVKKILLKEVWYFDKKYSRMDVRIIGMCPIIEMANDDGNRIDQKLTFWIYYPELRPFLSKQEVYNTRNDSQRDSFDDLFAKRRFGSYIFREENVYNNRSIIDYYQGMETTLESERIKNDIFIKEHDMWEY